MNVEYKSPKDSVKKINEEFYYSLTAGAKATGDLITTAINNAAKAFIHSHPNMTDETFTELIKMSWDAIHLNNTLQPVNNKGDSFRATLKIVFNFVVIIAGIVAVAWIAYMFRENNGIVEVLKVGFPAVTSFLGTLLTLKIRDKNK